MKVLFVVTAFYPEQAIGSIRISKFAKYLHAQGVDISVISLTPPPWAARDESLYFEGLKNISWDVVDQSIVFKTIFQKMRVATIGTVPGNAGVASNASQSSIKSKIHSGAQFFYTLLKGIDWTIRIRKHALKNSKFKDFDFIFCSYPSFASPFSGIQLKKLGIGRQLVVDFRDPILSAKTSVFNIRYLLQKYILKNTDLVTFVSKGVKNQVNKSIPSSNYLIAPNGFDLKDQENLEVTNIDISTRCTLRFVYTGAIYGGKRDLRPFFEAISDIITSSNLNKSIIQLEYAGKEGHLFLSQASEYNLSDYVVDHGQLSRLDSLKLQKESDICLLATWNTSYEQGALTGKIFEYFMFKKPIVAIVVGDMAGSEIYNIIDSIGAGHCFEEAASDSKQKLIAWLENAIDEKYKTGEIKNTYNDKVKSFDIYEVVINLKAKLDQMTKDQPLL